MVLASYKTPLTTWVTVRVVLLDTPKAAPLEPTLWVATPRPAAVTVNPYWVAAGRPADGDG
jgi:hypothetical protein